MALSLDFFKYHPNLCSEINKTLTERACDPEDKVRVAVCNVLTLLDGASFKNVSLGYLNAIKERLLDKKVNLQRNKKKLK